jgi:hypothetical protein
MAFVIRQISRAADGREIVRSSSVAASEIVVGRDAGCDVHLADLAVDLRHATITQTEAGRVKIEALGGLGFLVDGRRVQRADIDPATGAELRFGSHRLTLGRDGTAIAVSCERVEALSDAIEDREEIGLFTLKGLLPNRRVGSWLFLVTILAAFLAWPIYSFVQYQGVKERPNQFHADVAWSSGALSSAHKSLEKDCQSCHTKPFEAVRDTACVACHTQVHDHADPKRQAMAKAPPDFGGRLLKRVASTFNKPEGRCVECHTEHEGAGPMQPTAQVFCSSCHADMNTRLTDTKLPNAGDFGTSHPQFKPLVAIQAGRVPVYQRVMLGKGITDDSGLKFPHNMHLSATGGVARMAQTMAGEFGFGNALVCKDCHTPTPDGVRFKDVEMEQSCAMCHSLGFERIGDTVRTLRHGDPRQVVADLRAYYRSTGPVRPINLGGQARRRPGDYAQGRTYYAYFAAAGARSGQAEGAIRAVFSPGGACYDCHTVSVPPSGSDDYKILAVHQTQRYMQKGWFDHEPHKGEKCASCHAANTSGKATDLLLPGVASCQTCHGGEKSNSDVPSPCAMCHSYHARDGAPWVPRNRLDKENGVTALGSERLKSSAL